MKTIDNDVVWVVDIDDTLLLWDIQDVTVPYTRFTEPHLGNYIRVHVNVNNIRLMKEKKKRGATIILWSQGGYEYAEVVAKALDITKYVDYVMTKPVGVIDDLEASAWMPKAVNIPYTKNYKK
jgi:predicted phosphatase